MYSDNKNNRGGGSSSPSTWYILLILAFISLPFVIVNIIKQRSSVDQRKHTRYTIDSSVTVNVGGRQLVANVSSISLGGVQLNTDALLEDGGIVSMKIVSPDGKEQIEVEGRVVWSEQKKAYGVQFDDAKETVLESITNWTKSLVKN